LIPVDFHSLRKYLRQGGLIAYPTEYCFGLGCDPMNARAVRHLLHLKQRHKSKGLILIAAEFAQLRPYLAPLSEADHTRLSRYWPGPITLLMPAAKGIPKWLSGGHPTLAVRVTAHPEAVELCKGLDMALVSTSANLGGKLPLRSARACSRVFGRHVKVLSGRVGKRRRPSTIVDFASGSRLRA
jgi:L-threonylcarbamoyladenylate synthase